jgi:hypothetical protein
VTRSKLPSQSWLVYLGLPEAVLAEAESGTIEMTDEVSKEVQKVYWSLAALEATPADYRRLLKKMAVDSGGERIAINTE